MQVSLHKCARTTPALRAELQASKLSEAELVRKHGLSRSTVRKWRSRSSVVDGSSVPKRLQTTLSTEQEAVVVELRRTLRIGLDDLLCVAREFVCKELSRSALSRCLRRHGCGSLRQMQAEQAEKEASAAGKCVGSGKFKPYEPGFLHIDVKYLPKLPGDNGKRYLFVAIDRATRWVYFEPKRAKSAQAAKDFLSAVLGHCPFKVEKILTDNGKEFTDRFDCRGEREPTGKHLFDQACSKYGIIHRLTGLKCPQTNGMVERFNGRISEVLQGHFIPDAGSLDSLLQQYLFAYNRGLPQKALGHITPLQAIEQWYNARPQLFKLNVNDLPEPDSSRGLDASNQRFLRSFCDWFTSSEPILTDQSTLR